MHRWQVAKVDNILLAIRIAIQLKGDLSVNRVTLLRLLPRLLLRDTAPGLATYVFVKTNRAKRQISQTLGRTLLYRQRQKHGSKGPQLWVLAGSAAPYSSLQGLGTLIKVNFSANLYTHRQAWAEVATPAPHAHQDENQPENPSISACMHMHIVPIWTALQLGAGKTGPPP